MTDALSEGSHPIIFLSHLRNFLSCKTPLLFCVSVPLTMWQISMADIYNDTDDFCAFDENGTFLFENASDYCYERPRRFEPPFILVVTSYAIIFLLSIVGNILVVITLAVHKRMQTVTNILLLNLAISDLMMGIMCMPTSLIAYILRNFIFGEFLCFLQLYAQCESHE